MCAARAAQDGQRRSHTRQPEKIPPHVLMQAWNTRPPSFRIPSTVPSAALERSSLPATSGVPHRTNHVCSAGYTATRDPAAWVIILRGDEMPGQACGGGQETHIRMRVDIETVEDIPVDRRNNATAALQRQLASRAEQIAAIGALASRLDSTRRRTLWVSCL